MFFVGFMSVMWSYIKYCYKFLKTRQAEEQNKVSETLSHEADTKQTSINLSGIILLYIFHFVF